MGEVLAEAPGEYLNVDRPTNAGMREYELNATGMNEDDWAEAGLRPKKVWPQAVPFQEFGLSDLDMHRACRETEARDRATIARLEYNVQILQNYIRLKEEEHELDIRASPW
ncbi:hypothetical protein EDD37DRAFT_605601 [Exophiala viscosa]|uniref:uncharacterized protein n=1 Tax=Exophiala viscosa TaxID=2486360 RepID=UPI00219EA6E1|nr:hypothetical protein EDD37DRAFT_605601 [Exophiala viscosa]